MSRADFVEELRRLRLAPEELGEGKVACPYVVETGRFAGTAIWLGFVVPEDFALTPPGGVHVSPRLLPLQSGGTHPSGGVHDSPFGAEWQYWSRPIPEWASDRSVRAVLAHVRRLFDTQ
ncbi:MAG: hypothetical protein AB7U83_12590 [Vicinamibacterales bacterium]